MIEFVSYTGKFPNLCRGVLTVEIDDQIVKFGHDYDYFNYDHNCFDNEDKDHPNYDAFWISGGKISADKDYNMSAEKGLWKLGYNEEDYPQEIVVLFPELIDLFNKHVKHGCCGGCI